MNARKFIAVNSREAFKLVRVELGDDAVILSNLSIISSRKTVHCCNKQKTRNCHDNLEKMRLGNLPENP